MMVLLLALVDPATAEVGSYPHKKWKNGGELGAIDFAKTSSEPDATALHRCSSGIGLFLMNFNVLLLKDPLPINA